MIKRTMFTLALVASAVASAGAAHAQGEPTDPYGRPLIGRGDWVRQPGDQPGSMSGTGMQAARPAPMPSAPVGSGMNADMNSNMNSNMATAPANNSPMTTGSPSVAGEPRDPYGRPLIGRNDWVRQPGDRPAAR